MTDDTTLRRQRGVPGGQITKLKTKVDKWVSKGGLSAIDLLLIEQAKARLHTCTLDADFKRYRIDVIDALDEDDEIEREDAMEEHKDKMAHIIINLKSISSSAPFLWDYNYDQDRMQGTGSFTTTPC